MLKHYALFLAIMLTWSATRAQYFVGDVSFTATQAIFYLRPEGGDITGKLTILEYFLRWDQAHGNTFTFGAITPNTTDFPGINFVTFNNEAVDAGYNNQHFRFTGSTSSTKTYTNGVSYEAFRVNISNLPPAVELVADNTNGDPYYLMVFGDAVDYTPYGVSPLVDATGTIGDLYYKSYSLVSFLPVTLQSFTGKENNCNALLEWISSTEENSSHFDVQYSHDGVHYVTQATVPAKGNSGHEQSYSQEMAMPASINYYRLKMVDKDGHTEYSKTVVVKKNCSASALAVSVKENPVLSGVLRLSVANATGQECDIAIFERDGKLITRYKKTLAINTTQLVLNLPAKLQGHYFVRISANNQYIVSQSILVHK